MNGPGHYSEAERLLTNLPAFDRVDPDTGFTRTEALRAAQVHATLAQAAATIDAADTLTASQIDGRNTEALEPWREVGV